MQLPQGDIKPVSIKEMDILLLIFLGVVALKLIFVIPGTYGLYKDVGESKYFNMIYYLFEGKFYTSADDVTTHYPLFYPLMLLFTYYVKNYTFLCIMLLNSIFASSIVFPLYLLARRMLNREHSLILILVSSLIPFNFLIPNRLLSENLYFPLLLWSLYFAFVLPADTRQRLAWDALTGFTFGLLYLTRFISLAVIPFLMLIWWIKPFENVSGIFQWNWKKVANALMMVLITALVFSPWVYIGLNNGLSLKETLGFGIAATTNPQQLTLVNFLKWILLYFSYYVLLASPVLNLIAITFQTFHLGNLKDECGRWLLSLVLLLLAFSAAVVRHSWRAFYNLDMPERIMGRYVIYFVPLFLLTGFIGMSHFEKEKFTSFRRFLEKTSIFEFLLVVFSYLLVIDGRIMPIGNNFIEPLISIDGFYIQQLHLFFFVFILTQYFGSAYFLWYGRPGAVGFAGCVLIVFYLFAEPDCLGMLKKQNTYQKLGYDVSQMMLDADKAYGEKLSYTIYISDGIYVDDRKDFSWSLYIRNLECPWQIVKYPAEDKPKLGDEKGFVIYKLGETQLSKDQEINLIDINGEHFVVEQNLN
jgi:hypothetical protein